MHKKTVWWRKAWETEIHKLKAKFWVNKKKWCRTKILIISVIMITVIMFLMRKAMGSGIPKLKNQVKNRALNYDIIKSS